jgi:hypothetical protein
VSGLEIAGFQKPRKTFMVEALHDPHNIQVFKCLGIFGFSMGNEGFHQSKLAQWAPQN